MEDVTALSIPIPQQPEVLIVVSTDVLTKINELGSQAAALSMITTDIENEAAGSMLKVVTQLLNELDDNASAANKPYHDIQKAITKAKQTASKPLETIKASLKNSLTQYILKRDRERAEAEVAAANTRRAVEAAEAVKRAAEQAELDKLNAARNAEAAALNVPAPAPIILPVATPVSQGIIAKAPAAKADAVKTTRKMVCRIVDAGAVPRAYCIPDLPMIEAAWKRGEITPELHTFFAVEEVVTVSAK